MSYKSNRGTFWVSLLSGVELMREKQRDYRNIVITQVIIIATGLIFSGPILKDSTSQVSKLIITVFSSFGVFYTYLLWDLLRNFSRSKVLLMTFFVVFVGITLTALLIEFPYYKFIQIENRRLFLFVVHACLFPIEVTVIGFAIRDVFKGRYLTPDKLWGSACVYLMIGISFGSLYDLLCIIWPGSLGANLELGLPNYSECIAYSFRTLGGMDPLYPDAAKLVQNISILESIWGNLFTVLIIGKLLGLPKPEAGVE